MDAITIKYPSAVIDRALALIGARTPHALSRAMNRAVVTTRTVMARDIADDTNLGVRTVTKELKVTKASPDSLRARISVSGSKIPLDAWKPTASRRNGVRAKLPPPGKGRYPHAFIATMKSGHRGVFQRATLGKGSKRLPIYQLHGPALPAVFAKLSPRAIAAGQESLMKNFEHELGFEYSKLA